MLDLVLGESVNKGGLERFLVKRLSAFLHFALLVTILKLNNISQRAFFLFKAEYFVAGLLF